MREMIILILVSISGICWSIVYIECIRTGFKQKTYCMPLFALALNFADATDAKMQTLTEIFKDKQGNREWLGYNRLFETNLRRTEM